MKSNFDIVQQFKKHYKSTTKGLNKQYQNTRDCQAFYAGDLMAYRDSIQFAGTDGAKKKALVQFNKVKPYVNAVKGFMAQNRRSIKYVAKLDGNQLQEMYTKYCNSLKDHIRDEANADQVESQQDGDLLINGYGAVETAVTYGEGYASTDPNGQVIMGRLDPLQIGFDPYAHEPNLTDARWIFYQKDYALQDALELFDDSEEEDFQQSTDDDMGDENDYKWYPRGGRYNKIKEANVDWSDEKAQMVKVYFYQWYEYETYYRCDNPIYKLKNTDAINLAVMQLDIIAQENKDKEDSLFTFDPRAEILSFGEDIKTKMLESFGEFVEIVKFKRKTFYSAVLSGDHVFTSYKNLSQKGFSVKFKTGDYDSKNKIWTGMVNSMKEPVMYYNKALTELMFIIGANSKGGVLVEDGAVDDIQEFEQKYARTDAVIKVAQGALSGGKIQPKKQPFSPTGYENIIQLSDASISDVNGIDKSFLGSSENKMETGVLQKRRIKQVVSSLACYFDAITLFQKEHARLLLDYIRVYVQNNSGGSFRVLGEDGRDQYLKISEDKMINDYDVVIQEAPQSPEDKQETANVITMIADKILAVDPAGAKQLYAIAIKYMPVDHEDIQKIIGLLMPQDKQIDPAYVQQLEQQVKGLMSEVTQADVKKKLSEIALNAARTDREAADTHKVVAEATRIQQESVQKTLENVLMMKPSTVTTVNI